VTWQFSGCQVRVVIGEHATRILATNVALTNLLVATSHKPERTRHPSA
jgi:hypothetical protein